MTILTDFAKQNLSVTIYFNRKTVIAEVIRYWCRIKLKHKSFINEIELKRVQSKKHSTTIVICKMKKKTHY